VLVCVADRGEPGLLPFPMVVPDPASKTLALYDDEHTSVQSRVQLGVSQKGVESCPKMPKSGKFLLRKLRRNKTQ
jgi:hypothetical protein